MVAAPVLPFEYDVLFYADFLRSLVDENINPEPDNFSSNSECIAKLLTKNILLLSQKKRC